MKTDLTAVMRMPKSTTLWNITTVESLQCFVMNAKKNTMKQKRNWRELSNEAVHWKP